ncbi:MAG: carboxyl transferase domain-containing protein [Ardenticatenaceae bacterium]
MSHKLLIANRGEIAIRIAQAASELGMYTVTVYSEDDGEALHTRKSEERFALRGLGGTAYLDMEQLIRVAKEAGCDLIHPGYGFLSENAAFARRCAEEGVTFVGPTPEMLALFGDKIEARRLARRCGVPIIAGTTEPTTLEEAMAFFESLNQGNQGEGMMIKAMSGGGGRGMRAVYALEEVENAYQRCQSEAKQAFGHSEVYVERLIRQARHIEVQIIGDGTGAVSHLGERECSIQRRHQKLIEIAPAPGLSEGLRERLTHAAIQMAQEVCYANAGTFEFLVEGTMIEGSSLAEEAPFFFIEANARLQVEHTVTEEVTGIDLVQFQLQQALGHSLEQLELTQAELPPALGSAMQVRINMETMGAEGNIVPASGKLTAFEMPSGRGRRSDSFGYVGYRTNPRFDSLLAKVICHTRSNKFAVLLQKSYRALCECHIEGVATNLSFLQAILRHPTFAAGCLHTGFIDEHIKELVATQETHQPLFVKSTPTTNTQTHIIEEIAADAAIRAPEGTIAIKSPMPGSVVSIHVTEAEHVRVGQMLVVIEAMKMESVITAHIGGVVREIAIREGDVLFSEQPLLFIEQSEQSEAQLAVEEAIDLDQIRPDLAEMLARKAFTLDESRPKAIQKRRRTGQRTARENIADLCDEDTFVEYGSFIVAAQRRRRALDDLIKNTPADGLVTGIGSINGQYFGPEGSQCMVLAYDYTVLAGTQGKLNHKKTDRMLRLAEEWRIPIVIFAEGGGGRPGDTDAVGVAGLDVMTFALFARMSGLMPRISIVSRYCFAGNAALAGCADVIIATENTSIGMGGPAMIEGGGLGKYHPKEVGPVRFQTTNGVIDILVKDEVEGVAVAKKYLSYFQGAISEWECADQRLLRRAIPENRRRVYDMRRVINTLADNDSVLELRRDFGIGIITAFIRIEGRPLGLIANNPNHLGGAIDSDGADKAARFMQLCDAFGIPILSLCDTPGIMVGPDAEKTGTVRHSARLFVIGASLNVPYFTIVLRKGYGLGAQAMAAGSFHVPFFTIAWPTGEFGAMGLEGAVKLGFRKELAQAGSPQAQKALFDKMVADSYQRGKAINMASFLEIDQVIDPMDSRRRIISGLNSTPKPKYAQKKERSFVDTW